MQGWGCWALSLAAFLLGLNPILILFGGGLLGMLTRGVSSLGIRVLLTTVPRKNWFPSSLCLAGFAASGSIAAGRSHSGRPQVRSDFSSSRWVQYFMVAAMCCCLSGARIGSTARLADTTAIAGCGRNR